MEDARRPRRGLLVAIAFVPILLAAILWLPRWWEEREYRQMEGIAGVEARVSPGRLADARGKVHDGMKTDGLLAALGKPALSVATDGVSRREMWTYYYADGTLLINVTDGLVQRVSADFHPPSIPTSARPR
jgi:hypothetical protein